MGVEEKAAVSGYRRGGIRPQSEDDLKTKTLKCLDVFCGLGGWSKGFNANGFECEGVDIVDVGYPFKLYLQDARAFRAEQGRYDVVVGSPPCRDFTTLATSIGHRWKNPVNIEKSLELVNEFLRIVREAKPKFWLMENIPGLMKYHSAKPMMIAYLTPTMRRCFWGEFPPFLVPRTERKPMQDISGKYRSWKRAEIPFPIADTLAKAILQELKK